MRHVGPWNSIASFLANVLIEHKKHEIVLGQYYFPIGLGPMATAKPQFKDVKTLSDMMSFPSVNDLLTRAEQEGLGALNVTKLRMAICSSSRY